MLHRKEPSRGQLFILFHHFVRDNVPNRFRVFFWTVTPTHLRPIPCSYGNSRYVALNTNRNDCVNVDWSVSTCPNFHSFTICCHFILPFSKQTPGNTWNSLIQNCRKHIAFVGMKQVRHPKGNEVGHETLSILLRNLLSALDPASEACSQHTSSGFRF